jgi:hypothetical protein
MKRILSTDIPNTIDGDKKKALRNVSVVQPEDAVFAVGPGSWLADGREDYAIAAHIVGSIILSHDTDNRSDDAEGASFVTTGNRERKTVKGNPVIWGSLSQTQLTIMGTNEAPVLVVSAAGRQTAKASEWLSDFLRRCRATIVAEHGRLAKEKEEAQANLESLQRKLDKAKDKADIAARMEEQRKVLAKYEGKDIEKMARKDAVAMLQMEHDPIAEEFTQEHWVIIFRQSRKLGRPLVDLTYSAAVWLSVDYGSDLPSDRRSLEKSMLANLQVPSLPSTVAESARRLVRDYVLVGGDSEALALDKVRAYVRPLMAVGAHASVSAEYVKKMYHFSLLCPAAQRAVDNEKDPRKMLALFDKFTRSLYRDGKENIDVNGETRSLSRNDMSADEQVALMNPPKRAARAPRAKPVPASSLAIDEQIVQRLTAVRSPMSRYTEQQRTEAAAIVAWEAYRAGNKDALKGYPHLSEAIAPPAEENDARTVALDIVDHWDGKKNLLDEVPDFCEKKPKSEDKLVEWEARRQAHVASMEAVRKLLDAAVAAIPAGTKTAQRPVLAREWLERT